MCANRISHGSALLQLLKQHNNASFFQFIRGTYPHNSYSWVGSQLGSNSAGPHTLKSKNGIPLLFPLCWSSTFFFRFPSRCVCKSSSSQVFLRIRLLETVDSVSFLCFVFLYFVPVGVGPCWGWIFFQLSCIGAMCKSSGYFAGLF